MTAGGATGVAGFADSGFGAGTLAATDGGVAPAGAFAAGVFAVASLVAVFGAWAGVTPADGVARFACMADDGGAGGLALLFTGPVVDATAAALTGTAKGWVIFASAVAGACWLAGDRFFAAAGVAAGAGEGSVALDAPLLPRVVGCTRCGTVAVHPAKQLAVNRQHSRRAFGRTVKSLVFGMAAA